MSLKAKVEAVLFLTDKPVRAQAIAKVLNCEADDVRKALIELIHDYEERDGALEIADDNGYSIQVKDAYSSIVDEFLPVEMTAALVRTLSAIAIKQPVPQSDIVKIRGAGAYEHIKELVDRDLVSKREEGGRSPILTTTRRFQEYFRLTRDGQSLRKDLKRRARKESSPDDMPSLSDVESQAAEEAIPAESGASGGDAAVLERLLDSALTAAVEEGSAVSLKVNDQPLGDSVRTTEDTGAAHVPDFGLAQYDRSTAS